MSHRATSMADMVTGLAAEAVYALRRVDAESDDVVVGEQMISLAGVIFEDLLN